MNDENLIPNSQRSPKELREMTRKGGVNSGKARRRKGAFREAAQTILDGTYKIKDKATGEVQEMTGAEIVVLKLFKQASDEKNKNSVAAAKVLLSLTGDDKSPEEIAKIKSETDLNKMKNKLLKSGLGDDKQAISAIEQIAKSILGDDKKGEGE